MELALTLGSDHKAQNKDLGFCMVLGTDTEDHTRVSSSDPPLQLDLMPFSPVPRIADHPSSNLICFPWLSNKFVPERSVVDAGRRLTAEEAEAVSSPNSATVSSFQMEFTAARNKNGKRDTDQMESERASSRLSDDDDDNALTRKKLRLSKDQSAFLEESFKEHSTLNPKQKLALAKQLNLRPRQVEVWFQNRRARTKLKQTEVDCEYLKRCCEKLTEENRRLQKELQELRALKTPQPFFNQLPATTLTMCPSCERVASTTTTASSAVTTATTNSPSSSPTAKPRLMFPFSHAQPAH